MYMSKDIGRVIERLGDDIDREIRER